MGTEAGIGIAMIAIGLLYIVKPDLFRRWFWTRTSIAQRMLSPEGYLTYMRILGAVLVLVGIVFCFLK
jgi:hypothetical protein